MRRVLIVDSQDFERRFISVDLNPDPMPLLSDLTEEVRACASYCDTVVYLHGNNDPIVLKSPDLNLGQFPWETLHTVLAGTTVARRAKMQTGV